jgi:hypothetical protein
LFSSMMLSWACGARWRGGTVQERNGIFGGLGVLQQAGFAGHAHAAKSLPLPPTYMQPDTLSIPGNISHRGARPPANKRGRWAHLTEYAAGLGAQRLNGAIRYEGLSCGPAAAAACGAGVARGAPGSGGGGCGALAGAGRQGAARLHGLQRQRQWGPG